MNLFFIIGGIAVLAGITYMTVAYFQQAAELRKVTAKWKEEKELNESLWKALISESNAEDIKFGDF